MNASDIQKIKTQLLLMRQNILNQGQISKNDDLCIQAEDLPDEADLATSVINQQISFSMREREFSKLRAIEKALEKIEQGTYGLCEECDEAIDPKRLARQPFAELCVIHAEELERAHKKTIP